MSDRLEDTLRKVALRYPAHMIEEQLSDIPRVAFNIRLGLTRVAPKSPGELAICDLGGGVGLFSVGCAAHGFKRSVLIDDFNDAISTDSGGTILDLHRGYGVEVISRDVVATGLRGIEGLFDIITSFDSMEHWHHSPKTLFHEAVARLQPRGIFVLGVPNSVNIRKRLTVPLGVGNWSRMEDWYETPTFRGHVREPDASDLRYIARDLRLTDVAIVGRTWSAFGEGSRLRRLAGAIVDRALRLRPSLSAELYLVGVRG
jgi:2-polyprenyl-3-methyl-5-hydroxy-6-metoxy-1,4-benzoquinol methylase